MSSTGDLLRDLERADPRIGAIVREHYQANEDVLPHLMLADITRILASEPRQSALDVLERHLNAGDDMVRNLIATSFLENIGDEDHAIRAALGPSLSAALAEMEGWRPDGSGGPAS